MNVRAKRWIAILTSLVIMTVIALIILIYIMTRTKPVCDLYVVDERGWILESGFEKSIIEGNYWSYVRTSYVLVGQYPDYEYYKIPANVPRNDYDVENFYIDDNDFMYYHGEGSKKTSKLVVDLSSYQTDVDWDALKSAGVDMVMLRVGYRGYGTGAIVGDDMFAAHVEGAKEAGIDIGIYFFTQALNYEEGAEEADYAIAAAREYDITGPIVIDTEIVYDDEARTAELGVDERTDSIVGFCETVSNAGYEPLIYSNRNWFVQQLDMSKVGMYKLWLAQYANQPDFPYLYVGWQYTSEGRVPGMDADLDLNVWLE